MKVLLLLSLFIVSLTKASSLPDFELREEIKYLKLLGPTVRVTEIGFNTVDLFLDDKGFLVFDNYTHALIVHTDGTAKNTGVTISKGRVLDIVTFDNCLYFSSKSILKKTCSQDNFRKVTEIAENVDTSEFVGGSVFEVYNDELYAVFDGGVHKLSSSDSEFETLFQTNDMNPSFGFITGIDSSCVYVTFTEYLDGTKKLGAGDNYVYCVQGRKGFQIVETKVPKNEFFKAESVNPSNIIFSGIENVAIFSVTLDVIFPFSFITMDGFKTAQLLSEPVTSCFPASDNVLFCFGNNRLHGPGRPLIKLYLEDNHMNETLYELRFGHVALDVTEIMGLSKDENDNEVLLFKGDSKSYGKELYKYDFSKDAVSVVEDVVPGPDGLFGLAELQGVSKKTRKARRRKNLKPVGELKSQNRASNKFNALNLQKKYSFGYNIDSCVAFQSLQLVRSSMYPSLLKQLWISNGVEERKISEKITRTIPQESILQNTKATLYINNIFVFASQEGLTFMKVTYKKDDTPTEEIQHQQQQQPMENQRLKANEASEEETMLPKQPMIFRTLISFLGNLLTNLFHNY